MHGYQIIQQIEERSGGSWKPSAGSVYPTLQLLADEGLIEVEESDGRKTYSLTEAGRVEAEGADRTWRRRVEPTARAARRTATAHCPRPVSNLAAGRHAGRSHGHARAGRSRRSTVLDDARRKLYSILAQD